MSRGTIKKELFGKTTDEKEVYKFTLVNKNGLVLEIISYGAVIVGIKCPDKNGKLDDITLGFDDFGGKLYDQSGYCMQREESVTAIIKEIPNGFPCLDTLIQTHRMFICET